MPITRDLVFDRVDVDFLVAHGARVSWQLFRQFAGVTPYSFQLQVGETGTPDADDWADVGPAVENAAFAVDDERRASGKTNRVHYRVQLTAADGIHYSKAVPAYGLLNKRDWLLAREILRKERLRHMVYTSWEGWLLKRRLVGELTPTDDPTIAVTDPLTGEIVRSQQTETFGTEYAGGYYTPYPVWFDLDPDSRYPARDPARGNTDDVAVMGRMEAYPQLLHNDVFVHKGSDRRYYIHRVSTAAHHRGVPLIARAELRLAPASDPVYDVEI